MSSRELNIQQAADILGVSRSFLIARVKERAIPFRKVGTHRRIRYDDLMKYKRAVHEKRYKVLEKLAAQAQELNMGY